LDHILGFISTALLLLFKIAESLAIYESNPDIYKYRSFNNMQVTNIGHLPTYI